jgi:hypothetical protein
VTEPSDPDKLLDVRETAELLGCSPDTVYENRERYGAVRLGTGPRARLRFHKPTVLAALGIEQPVPAAPPVAPAEPAAAPAAPPKRKAAAKSTGTVEMLHARTAR